MHEYLSENRRISDGLTINRQFLPFNVVVRLVILLLNWFIIVFGVQALKRKKINLNMVIKNTHQGVIIDSKGGFENAI